MFKNFWKGIFILTLNVSIIFYLISYKKIQNNKNDEYDLVIPSNILDIQNFLNHEKFYEKYLGYKNIILIVPSNCNICNELNFNETSISFIKEDKLVPKEKIIKYLWEMRAIKSNRVGWYEQQFIKMAYSRICKKKYYLVWDADTIPIKPIEMFQGIKPLFDMKSEHHIPYFNIMEKLIPGLNFINESYISEHMIIKTELMKILLKDIEKNHKIPGKLFWEKILMCIDNKDIHKSGFSEYEFYGTFIDNKYPNLYNHRKWCSIRNAVFFYNNSENLNEKDIKWLSQDFHALSFERWKKFKFKKENLKFIKDSKIQKIYRPKNFFENYKEIFLKYKK